MKYIPLSRGYVAIVDDEDYEPLSRIRWYALVIKRTPVDVVYAAHAIYGRAGTKMLLMHRAIINPPASLQIDHVNRDGLDNRRSNLRVVSRSENMLNRRSHNPHGFRGVYLERPTGTWTASIRRDKRVLHLGRYRDKKDAAIAYDMAALLLNGDFAQTNILKVI